MSNGATVNWCYGFLKQWSATSEVCRATLVLPERLLQAYTISDEHNNKLHLSYLFGITLHGARLKNETRFKRERVYIGKYSDSKTQ
jgi:hypothetical protein